MPKRIFISFAIVASLGLLLVALGCGSGDKVAAPRTEDALGDIFSGGTDTTSRVGGGGGGTNACITINTSATCANGISEANCSASNQIWYGGFSCADLGL